MDKELFTHLLTKFSHCANKTEEFNMLFDAVKSSVESLEEEGELVPNIEMGEQFTVGDRVFTAKNIHIFTDDANPRVSIYVEEN